MAFEFKVKAAGRLGKVWYLDGELLSGSLCHDATATVQTPSGLLSVVVRTVAFVDPPRVADKTLTITIDEPNFDITLLRGMVLVNEQP
jgi:hypothetical protein